MKRNLLALPALALAALIYAGGPAPAQDAEQLTLAREMLVVMRAADNFDAVMPTIMNALKPAITAGNPKAAKDWDELAPMMVEEFSSMKQSLLDDIAKIYAQNFDKVELRSFIAFYKSPAGDKLAKLTPALAQQTMVVGQKFGQQTAVRVAERMKEELRKRGNKI